MDDNIEVATVGSGRPLAPSPDIRFLLWPPAPRGTATVDPRTGIVVTNIHYWHADMRSAALRGKKVRVRVDPHDLAHVVAFLQGRWVLCAAECRADFAGRSRRELRVASMELRRRRRGAGKRQAVRARELGALLRELAKTEEGLLQARREDDRRAVLQKRGLRLVPDSPSTPPEDHPGSDDSLWSSLDFDAYGSGKPL